MKHIQTLRVWATALGMVAMTALAMADEGHDHDEAPGVAAEPALARFEATSDQFELVGVLDGRKLTLYLDQASDNSPVKGARLEVEFAGKTLPIKPIEEGTFEATLATEPGEGEHPVSATVVAGEASDLLVGELDVHVSEHTDASPSSHVHSGRWLVWALSGLALAATGVFFIQCNKRTRMGDAA